MSKKKNPRNQPRSSIKNAGSNPVGSSQAQTKKPVSKKNFFAEHWRQLSIISLLAIGLYIQTLSFNYVLDDTILVENNKFTSKGVAGIPEIFSTESFKGYFGDQKEMVEGGRYRPLSIATFALEKSITGGNKAIAHLINVLLYSLTGMFLYRVLLFMFPKARSEINKTKWFFTLPFVATMIFIAHPLHVEAVANVKGRDEILAFLGELGVLYFSFKWMEKEKTKFLVCSFLCYFLGILSKENVITFLAIVPLTAYFFTKSSVDARIKIMLPLIIATIFYLVIRQQVLGHLFSGQEIANLMNNPFYGMSFGERTATVFYTLLLYLKLLIYPHPLTHDYYPYHIPIMSWSNWTAILSLLLHLFLIIIAIRQWKKKSAWAYGILFYMITLSIVSNLVISVGTFMNERFVYHALLGFSIVAAWLLVEKLKIKKLGMAIFVAATIALSAKTLVRIPDWKTMESLDTSALKVSPNSARANHFYGMLMWGKNFLPLKAREDSLNAQLKTGIDSSSAAQIKTELVLLKVKKKTALDSLKPYFDKALQILPSYTSANSMKAGIAAEYHKMDNDYAKLVKAFEEVNLTGTYEKFILEYLHYVNPRVNNRKDAELLEAFYKKMISFNEIKFKNTTLPSEYRTLLKEIQERMKSL
jgi:hypothetical protein